MVIGDIKTKFFDILSKDLGYATKDHAEAIEDTIFPNITLSTTGIQRTSIHGVDTLKYVFVLDIFSKYDGEKELLEMEEAIFDNLRKLYEIDGVVYIQESSFRIMEDKSTGVVLQHGKGRYSVYVAGTMIDVEDNEDETNSSSEQGG